MVMMPRLEAQEAIRLVRIGQIAGGQFEPNSDAARGAQQTLADWEAAAEGRDTATPSKERGKDERRKTRAALFGMGVKKVTKGKPDATD